MARPFEEYALALGLPGTVWVHAQRRLQLAHRTTNERKQANQPPNGEYRLLTALDYYLEARSTPNMYIRFLLMLFVGERLFKESSKGGDKVCERIRRFVPDYGEHQLTEDYNARNDLVHGPKRIVEVDEARELADRWTTISSVVLSRILTEDCKGELPDLNPPAPRT